MILVLEGGGYEGADFSHGVRQPVDNKQVQIFLELKNQKFNPEVIRDKECYLEVNIEGVRNSLNRILKIYTERASKEEQDIIICQAMNEVFEGYEGAYITKEHIQKLSSK